MSFTRLEPNSVNTTAEFTFANISTDSIKVGSILFPNGAPWLTEAAVVVAGNNTEVQFNNSGDLGSSANFTFDTSSNTLTVTNIVSDGSGLANLVGANVTGAVAYATTANAVAGANVSGEVSYANIANSVSGANVSGDVIGATHANIADVANSVASGNIVGQVANALVSGTVYTNAQPNITSVGNLTHLNVDGDANIPHQLTAGEGSFTGNVSVNGNLTVLGTTTTVNNQNISSANTIVELHDSGAPLTGNDYQDIGILMHVFTSADDSAFVGRIGTSGEFAYFETGSFNTGTSTFSGSFGTIKGKNFISTVATGTAPLTVTSTTPVANLASQFAQSVLSSSQPNITSLGILTGLVALGNISSGNATLGNLVTANFFAGDGYRVSNITGANITGFVPNSAFANNSGNAAKITSTDDTTTDATYYPLIQTGISGNNTAKTSSSKLSYNPSTGTLSATTFAGSANITALKATSSANLGSISTVKIAGGLPGQVLTTDGLGNLAWAVNGAGGGYTGAAGFISITKDTFTANGSGNTYTLSSTPASVGYISINVDGIVQLLSSYTLSGNVVTLTGMPNAGETIEVTTYGAGGNPGGANTQVQFNVSNTFQGSPAFTFNSSTSTLTVTNIVANGAGLTNLTGAHITGNAPYANHAYYAGNIVASSQPNITTLGTLTSLSVAGDLSVDVGSNASLGNVASANMFSGNGYSLSYVRGSVVTGDVPNAAFSTTSNLASYATNIVASAQPNITSLGSLANLTVTGLTTSQLTSEIIATKTGATGVVTHDVTTSSVFYHSGVASDFTANFTNFPALNNRATVVILVIAQGATAYIPSAVQIDGVSQTINWGGGAVPVGYPAKKDMVSFTFIKTGGAWTVFGQLATYG